jgi:hypothetical protein
MEQFTLVQLEAMLERGELSPSVFHRRLTLMAIAGLATKSKSHTPGSRRRLKALHAALDGMEGNDEIEVTGETFTEVLLHAMEGHGQP